MRISLCILGTEVLALSLDRPVELEPTLRYDPRSTTAAETSHSGFGFSDRPVPSDVEA